MIESGKFDVAYVKQGKTLPCVSQNIQNFFVATDCIKKPVWVFLRFRGHLHYSSLNLYDIIQIHHILHVFFLLYATNLYF